MSDQYNVGNVTKNSPSQYLNQSTKSINQSLGFIFICSLFVKHVPSFLPLQIWTCDQNNQKKFNLTFSFLEHYSEAKLNQKSPKDAQLILIFTMEQVYTYFWWRLAVGDFFGWPGSGSSKIDLTKTAQTPQITQKVLPALSLQIQQQLSVKRATFRCTIEINQITLLQITMLQLSVQILPNNICSFPQPVKLSPFCLYNSMAWKWGLSCQKQT